MNASWNGRHDAACPSRRAPRRGPPRWTRPGAAPGAARPGGDALIAHHLVHEPEAPQRLRVAEDVLKPGRSWLLHLARLVTASRPSSRRCSGSCRGPRLLPVEPVLVRSTIGDSPARSSSGMRRQASACRAARRPPRPRSAGSRATGSHVVHTCSPGERPRPRPSRPSRSARPRTPAGCGTAGSAAAPRRPAPSGRPAADRRPAGTRAPPSAVTVSLVWYSQASDRDLPRRLPVVAQRDLDQAAVRARVVVAVDAQQILSWSGIPSSGLAEVGRPRSAWGSRPGCACTGGSATRLPSGAGTDS